MLFTPGRVELFVQTPSASLSAWHRDLRNRPMEGVFGAAIETRQPVIVPRPGESPETQRHRQAPNDGLLNSAHTVDFICIPIVSGKKVVGVISADLPEGVGNAIEELVRFLKLMALLIAIEVRHRRAAGPRRENWAKALTLSAHGIENDGRHSEGDPATINGDLTFQQLESRIRNIEKCIRDAFADPSARVEPEGSPLSMPFSDLLETATGGPLKASVRILERILITRALRNARGNINKAASELGITGRMLRYKAKNLGVGPEALLSGSPPATS